MDGIAQLRLLAVGAALGLAAAALTVFQPDVRSTFSLPLAEPARATTLPIPAPAISATPSLAPPAADVDKGARAETGAPSTAPTDPRNADSDPAAPASPAGTAASPSIAPEPRTSTTVPSTPVPTARPLIPPLPTIVVPPIPRIP